MDTVAPISPDSNPTTDDPFDDKNMEESTARRDAAEKDPAKKTPRIVIGTNIAAMRDEVIRLLSKMGGVYQRGRKLVQVVPDHSPSLSGHARPTVISEIRYPHLVALLSSGVEWVRLSRDKEGREISSAVRPDKDALNAVLAAERWDGVPPITGVVGAPTMRPDGTWIQTPGYDSMTGLYYEPTADFAPVPAAPSAEQVAEARELLLSVIQDFPFEKSRGKSVWVASVLTRFARFAFKGNVPLFAVSSNSRGTGKGKLVDASCLIADGRPCPKEAAPRSEEEADKRILSRLLAGSPVACFDNVPAGFELGSAAIDNLLTNRGSYAGRILGRSETTEIEAFTIWWATGNSLRYTGDLARRAQRIDLRTSLEKPDTREDFEHADLDAWVLAERPRLVGAVCTLLAGWVAAGRPVRPLPAFGSFEAWSGMIRQCVVWAGMEDPHDPSCEGNAGADAAASLHGALLDALEITIVRMEDSLKTDEGGVSTSSLCALVEHDRKQRPAAREYPELLDVLGELSKGTTITAVALGKLFAQYEKKVQIVIRDGVKVSRSLIKTKGRSGNAWAVQAAEDAADRARVEAAQAAKIKKILDTPAEEIEVENQRETARANKRELAAAIKLRLPDEQLFKIPQEALRMASYLGPFPPDHPLSPKSLTAFATCPF